MNRSSFIRQWSETMAKPKHAAVNLKKKKEIKVNLIPVYISDSEFQEKKEEVQDIITKILISTQKRGRPSMKYVEDSKYAA